MAHQRLMKILNCVQYSKYSYGLLTNDCVNNSSHRCESLKLYFLICFYVEASHCDSWLQKSYILWLLRVLMPFFLCFAWLLSAPVSYWNLFWLYIHSRGIVTWEWENWYAYMSMSAFMYATFSGLNWTMVCEHWSVWFVCAGVNTIIALGCGPEKKEKRIPSQFNGSGKVIQHRLFWS